MSEVVDRLMRRAHTLNGKPVGGGDGDTYIPGEYTWKDAALDQEAYVEITRLRALVEELKADRIRINDEAETEIKRLRKALKTATSDLFFIAEDPNSQINFSVRGELRSTASRARKALEGGE